jgi:hypothetical protein
MVLARLKLNDYANRVLNVVKAKYALHDKSDALNKFVEIFGDEFVEKEASDAYIKKMIEIEKRHFQKHQKRRMSKKEFCELFEMN